MGEFVEKQNSIYLSPQRKKKSWLHSPPSSVSVKDKHSSTVITLRRSQRRCVCMQWAWVDRFRLTHASTEISCSFLWIWMRTWSGQEENQQPLVSISTHKLEVCYIIQILTSRWTIFHHQWTESMWVHSTWSSTPRIVQKSQERVTKFRQ